MTSFYPPRQIICHMIEKVRVIESWKVSVRNEILADIEHSLNGLNSETVLRSDLTGLTWKVVSRIIFQQVENQKRFPTETDHFQHFVFRSMENMEKFRQDIQKKDSSGIHQYAIQPIGHGKKPENGEILSIRQSEPPDYLDGAKVVLWAWSGQQPFGFVSNEDGTERQEIYGLAICNYEGKVSKEPIYRFSCDINWAVIQDSIYDTIENAISFLPDQYRNVAANWLPKSGRI